MVWTVTQTNNFFRRQMDIPLETILSLNAEGIININDLAEFDTEDISAIVSDFCRRIPEALFGAKSQ